MYLTYLSLRKAPAAIRDTIDKASREHASSVYLVSHSALGIRENDALESVMDVLWGGGAPMFFLFFLTWGRGPPPFQSTVWQLENGFTCSAQWLNIYMDSRDSENVNSRKLYGPDNQKQAKYYRHFFLSINQDGGRFFHFTGYNQYLSD